MQIFSRSRGHGFSPSTPRVKWWPTLWIVAFIGACSIVAGDRPESEAEARIVSDAADAHIEVYQEDLYPSARVCAECHTAIYEEWSSSSHAYASISPMFHKFEQTLNELAQGTVGAFCVRCHIPIGTALGEPRHAPLWDRAAVSMEGITCIVCHRVKETYGRVNGNRRIEPGSIFEPVYGGTGGPGLEEVLANSERYGVATADGEEGTPIHGDAIENPILKKSEFCVSCHQVAVHPGIKLEVVWDQFLNSPAHAEGRTCQDCHMGATPGIWDDGYLTAPRAIVNSLEIEPGSKHSDHSFVGPGYSIAHPGIFPHNVQASGISIKEWMSFDWRADWGKDEFESSQPDEAGFPPAWKDARRRYEARTIVEKNQAKLEARKKRRLQVMENGSHIDGPFFRRAPKLGKSLRFHYKVTNICAGHSLPSGSLGAQPEIWLNVALIDPTGTNVWESGYVDDVGDMADLHSQQVLDGDLPHDGQLFNLQTKFLTTNVKGTDREMYLPVNFDLDQIPFIRPSGTPITVMNHPPFIRMEQRSIPPLTTRKASYSIPAKHLSKPGTYKLAVRLRSRSEPIYFMQFVRCTEEMIHTMNERMVDIHPYTVEFEVE